MSELRIGLVAGLHIGIEAAANVIPGFDIAADVALAVEIGRTTSQYKRLAIDAAAALDFIRKGPHSLEDLQVSSNGYEEFSTMGQFYKEAWSKELLAKRFGPAGNGN